VVSPSVRYPVASIIGTVSDNIVITKTRTGSDPLQLIRRMNVTGIKNFIPRFKSAPTSQ
jgi:hypothetical protein